MGNYVPTLGGSCANDIRNSLYDYQVDDIQGDSFDLAAMRGKVLLISNVASQ